jgi:hypothetical protein
MTQALADQTKMRRRPFPDIHDAQGMERRLDRIERKLARPRIFSGRDRDNFNSVRRDNVDHDYAMKIALLAVILLLFAWFWLWAMVPVLYPGSLQIRDGKGRVISGHFAVGWMQGVPMPTGPGVGLPHFTRDGKPSGQ